MSAPTFPDVFNLADYFLFDRLAEGLGAEPAVPAAAKKSYVVISDSEEEADGDDASDFDGDSD